MRKYDPRPAICWILAAIAIGQPVYPEGSSPLRAAAPDCETIVLDGLAQAGHGEQTLDEAGIRGCIADAAYISSAGRTALALVERGAIEPPPAGPCPGALLWREGRVHEGEPGRESLRIEVPTEAGERYERLIVDLDVNPERWYPGRETDNHNLVWINRGDRWRGNVLAYVNLFGPPAPGREARLKIASNLETGRRMQARSTAAALELATPYHLRYVLDTAAGTMTAVLTADGREPIRVSQRVEAREIVTGQGGIFVVLGHGPASPGLPEVPSLDWTYDNLCVRLE